MQIIKRDKSIQNFDFSKIEKAVKAAFKSINSGFTDEPKIIEIVLNVIQDSINVFSKEHKDITVENIQDIVEKSLMSCGQYDVAKEYIIYRENHKEIRNFAQKKIDFINTYKKSSNTANATIDDNSNVANKNIAVLNSEIHKEENQNINLTILENKLKQLYPGFDYKDLRKDLDSIAYLHDSSSQIGMPYCVAITMYPFLLNGIKDLGGLSAKPKNLDSFCGIFINLVFAIAAQFKGAVATPGI